MSHCIDTPNALGENIVLTENLTLRDFSSLPWCDTNDFRRAFTTRRAKLDEARSLMLGTTVPRAGDLVLASVTRLGAHQRIELPTGRRSQLYEGDQILVAYGARYAPDQFEAVVPSDLGPCDLVAGGGVAARVLTRHGQIGEATKITPIGLLTDRNGAVLNLNRWAIQDEPRASDPIVIAVVGTSMNAGKTTTAKKLIKGLTRAGLKVGAAKVTGTGSGGDLWAMADAGACQVVDFTDSGHASTYLLDRTSIVQTACSLIDHLASLAVDVSVIEVADGLFQRETAMLLDSREFTDLLDGVVFSAFDAAGAAFGVDRLRRLGLPLLALSGMLSTSPLGAREASAATSLPVLSSSQLEDPETSTKLIARLRRNNSLEKLRA
jgi:hypothetical protein